MTSKDEPTAHDAVTEAFEYDDTASIGKDSTVESSTAAQVESSVTSTGSPSPSQSGKYKFKQGTDDALSAGQLESLYQDLPEDNTALKAIVGTMRLEISKRDQTISKLHEEIDEVKASHSVILQRSAEWQDELETLRWKVPKLEAELRSEKQAKEAETDRVKDLRLRAEESRRAIMRLQGEQQGARAKAKADNRRSMVPGTFAGWAPPATASIQNEQEDVELKKSKRTSLAFGPNAGLAIQAAGRPGHRRTASGSRSVSGNSRAGEDEPEEPLSPTLPSSSGLRGLRLSGTPSGAGSSLLLPGLGGNADDASSQAGSRRSSFQSASGRSPRMAPTDGSESNPPSLLLGGRLAVPGGANSSRPSLGGSSPALSQTGSTGVASPIMEDGEEFDHQPSTANTINGMFPPSHAATRAEVRARDIEIERMTREMGEMRTRMEEALEARQASEACLKVLRDFISTHDAAADANELNDQVNELGVSSLNKSSNNRMSVGAGLLKGVKLPPLPTDTDGDEFEFTDKRSASPTKGLTGGWSMKLPTLMRKNTVSSNGASSTGVTPSDEMGSGEQASSPSKSAAAPGGPAASSIGGSLASFGSLLSRHSISMASSPFAAKTNATSPPMDSPAKNETSAPDATRSPPIPAGASFKGFNWFKKGAEPGPVTTEPVETEEKVQSPPFRSLDHDQVAISRQNVVASPEVNISPSHEMPPRKPNEPELSYRAQKAQQKTANVTEESVFVPAAFD